MSKYHLIYPLLFMTGLCASASTLTPSEALSRAVGQSISRSAEAIAPVMTFGAADTPALYVFNRPESGWLIVAADDVAAPIIGYSDTGSFDTGNLPDNLRGWLEMYGEQINAASAAGAEPYRVISRSSDKTPIEPLVKTKWNQGAPYSNDCPSGGTYNCYTGCVATAMAQVMKYHNWPVKANENAVFSYNWNSQTLSADFSNYEFDWENMLNQYYIGEYNKTQGNAVAKLMQACGYSVRMRYGSTASAAYSEQVGNALVTYFNYDGGLHNEFRSFYTSSAWEDMIYDNLKNVGPMVYWGGVHCFVCDGYRSDGYFHFNWGWSGMSDGYFLLTALAPGAGGIGSGNGDYTPNQGALLGIKPATGDNSSRCYTFRIDELNRVTISSSMLTIQGSFVNSSPYAVSAKIVYQFYNLDGTEKIKTCDTYTAVKNWGIDIVTGMTTSFGQMMGNITDVPDGTYRVYPAVEIDGVEYPFQSPPTIAGYVLVTCENGKPVTAEIPSNGELVIENIDTHGEFFDKSYIKISGIAKFTGDGDTNTPIVAVLLRPDGSVRAYSGQVLLDFTHDGKPFEFTIAWFNDKGLSVEPGEYTFGIARIVNGMYNVLGTCPVKVNEQVLTPTIKPPVELTVGNADAVNPESIKITATVEGNEGVVYQDLIFNIVKGITTVKQQYIPYYVSAGQTTDVVFEAALPNAKSGETYYVYVMRLNRGKWESVSDNVHFTIGDFSGINDVAADNDAPVEYINLQGVQVSGDNLTPGIYIRRQGTSVSKVLIK